MELLVVIAIMSILTVITASQFGAAQRRSRDMARKADLSSLSKALLTYYADYGFFPAEDEISWGGEFKDDTDYIYMKVVPQENYERLGLPAYCYVAEGVPPTKFALFSGLENEEDSDGKFDAESYDVCGGSYNFAIVSPNAEVADF